MNQFYCEIMDMEFEIECDHKVYKLLQWRTKWSISMLKSPKNAYVGHGVGAVMMNSCNISKKIVSEVEWNLYKEITCMIFMVFWIQSSCNKIQFVLLFCMIAKLHCCPTLLHCHGCQQHIYNWYFVVLKWNVCSILVSWRHNMSNLCYNHVEDLDNVCATN
jgi:hypothetical protein